MFCTFLFLSIYNYSLHLWVKLNNISATSCITCIENEVLSGPFDLSTFFIGFWFWILVWLNMKLHYIIGFDLKRSLYLFAVFHNKVISCCLRKINPKFAGTKICILFLMASFDTLAIKAVKCHTVDDWLGGQLFCTKNG